MTTNDSGLTWTYRLKVDSFYFEKVKNINQSTAIAIGSQHSYNWNWYNKGILARSVNSGVTWDTSYFPYHLKTIEKVNDSILFVVGKEHSNATAGVKTYLLKSIDKGISWVEVPFAFQQDNITDLKFITDSIALMTGINSKIYKSTNQGNTWTSSVIDSSTNYTLISMSAPSLSKLFVLSYGGSLLSSSDTGLTWNIVSTINGSGFGEIEFVNDTVGFIPSSGIFKTIVGGVTWKTQTFSRPTSTVFHALADIFPLTSATLYVAGSGQFYRTYNGGDSLQSTSLRSFHSTKLIKVYPNPFQNEINIAIDSEKNLTFNLYDITGQRINVRFNPSSVGYKFNVDHLKNGLYLLQVISGNENKIIKLLKE